MSQADYRDRQFLAVIGDEVRFQKGSLLCQLPPLTDFQDSVTGLLLAGIGVSTLGRRGREQYLIFR